MISENTTASGSNTVSNSSNQTNPNTVISGTVSECQGTGPFAGATIKVESLAGVLLATTTTGSDGKYSVSFFSNENTFKVTSMFPGHVFPTKIVNVSLSASNSTKYGTADLKMGTLQLTKGSWDIIGLDSNNVNVGPNQFLIQIHVTNNAATTANNVVSTLTFTTANTYINLAPGETAVKNLGNIAPGATVDVFYLIEITRNAAAYDTTRNYTINVAGTNTGSPVDSITGQLYVEHLVSQNRNQVISITVSDPNPSLGDTIAVTVVSATSASNYDVINLPLTQYNPNILVPVSMSTTYGASNTNNIRINLPGANSFVSVWYYKVIGTGVTNLFGLITDLSGSSYHYNTDFGENITINATKSADLAITKTVNNTSPNVGQNVRFTLEVTNLGPNDATNVVVNDLLPAGLTFVSATPSVGSYNSGTGVWTIGNLAVNATVFMNITATVTQTGQINNIANVTGTEPDPNLTNNQDIVVLNGVPTADLAIQKTVNNATPNNGQNVTYTILVSNAGPNTAENVVVEDILPSGLIFVSATPSQGSFNPITGIWTIGTLLHPGSATLTIVATANQTGLITNKANVTSTTYDPHPEDNESTVDINVQPSADLQTVKVVNNTTPNVGDNVVFTITVINNGPDDATGVNLTDFLPTGLTYVSSSATTGSYDNNTGIWSIGSLLSGASEVLTITATVDTVDNITNIASVFGNEFDPNLTNNQDLATLNSQPTADLVVTKTADPTTVNNGQTVTFTITVFNAGPNTATGVVLTDLLPAGLNLVSATPSQGSYNSGTGIWTIGTLLHTGSATLTIVATANQTGFITNIANVTGNEYDPHPEDNTDAVTIQVNPTADMAVIKTVNNTTPNVGQNVVFTITVNNLGPNNATGVVMNDLLPAGLVYVSSNASQGSYNSATGVWTIGSVLAGSSAALNITALVNQTGNIVNIATVAANEFDPNLNNNQDLAVINGEPTADLAVTKIANPLTLNNGQTVTFTINVSNAGPNTATGVVLTDLLPAGLNFVSATPSQGSYNSGTGVWTIGTIPHPGSVSMVLVALATQQGIFTNIANVTGNEYDPHPEDNNASVSISVNPAADLAVTKNADNRNPTFGSNVVFHIVVTNNGPDDATGVVLNDILPSELIYVSHVVSAGTFNPVTGIWTIGNLISGNSETLNITATVNGTGSITNIATVTGREFDPDTTNNQAIEVLNGIAADMSIAKTVSQSSILNGQTTTFTITVFNAGPDDNTNVVVNDLIPAGLEYVSHTVTQGTFIPGTGVWNVGNMANQTYANMTLVVRAITSGVFTNLVNVTGDLPDPHPDDNNASATVEVRPVADVGVVKTANNYSPNYTQNVNFTISVHNYGPDTATGVSITDILPSGLTYLSSVASQGSYNSGTGIWTVGTLANGATSTLNILARVLLSNTTIENSAVKTSQNEFDNNTSNDFSNITLQIPPAAALYLKVTTTTQCIRIGNNVWIRFKLGNNGPDTSENVVVTWIVPRGLEFVSANPEQGYGTATYDAATRTLTWNVGDLPVIDPYLDIIVALITPGEYRISPSVASATFNPTPNNITQADLCAICNCVHGSSVISMQPTGMPVIPLLLGLLVIVAGFLAPRNRKN